MTHKFDLEKAMRNGGKCMTRDGKPVRIICTDMHHKIFSIIALVDVGDLEVPEKYQINGKFYSEISSEFDLVNIPEKKTGWVNILWSRDSQVSYVGPTIYETEEQALYCSPCLGTKRIATVQLGEWEVP